MSKTTKKTVKVKEENEIQSYINSFKEIEEPEENPTTSGNSKKSFLESNRVDPSDYEEIIVRDDADRDDDFKYVFIVQDEEDGAEEKTLDVEGEVYEFDEYEEDAVENIDDKSKIEKVITQINNKKGGFQAGSGQGTLHMCSYCNYRTPKRYLLARHMKCHSEDRPHKCNVCERGFKTVASLTNHAHKMIHSVGEKPVFQCELCPTTCGRKTDLRIHVQKLHTSDVPIKCRRCDNEFPDRYSYKIHAKTHDGEKCYRCELCAYASISARHLESHMLIHTDQKPFSCQYCEQTFRQKQLLKRHENIYHNPDYVAAAPREKNHHCPTCNKAFRHKGNLMRHIATHEATEAVAHVKGEQEEIEENYVVIEVFQKRNDDEEQYEDEGSELELEDEEIGEEMETIVEENYSFTENINTDDLITTSKSTHEATSSGLCFGFSDEDSNTKN
ncbi:CLUMA_CG006267, isoform A [Clunio marinus]|uniref:CLUMA_CG006267, isoform A n=1 Tax=Clunio marinus TaxID=568069 RepID=A0A1J1HZ04_9DIPT|nr:CLUMA_CG006267, isoform A [Clunio marinus]